jgi:hypothetical protein
VTQSRSAMSLAVLASAGVLASVGCGAQSSVEATTVVPRGNDLAGWHAVEDPPGISQLAPDLGGLHVATRTDRKALVRNGEAVRATTLTFATPKEAAEARKRGAGDDYQAQLERAFHGTTIGRLADGLRLRVPRPTGTGSDMVEVYLLARGRRLTIVELLSARGFAPELRDRVLRLSR